jgi:hypothetical protein
MGGGTGGGASAMGGGGGAGATGGGSTAMGGGSGAIGGGSGMPSHWIPAADTTFFWDLQSAPPDLSKNVGAIDMDGFNNSAQTVTALHMQGKKAVCYMDVGSYEPNRPDSAQFPAGLIGADVVGWPGEKWLDVRPSGPHYAELQAIMVARFRVCQEKGFDAVEPDNMESYTNSPGFPTSAADQIAFNKWVADTVHALGMAVFQKNDLDQIPQLIDSFDGILDEECNQYSECAALAPYVTAHKPAWNAEYSDEGATASTFCPDDVTAGITGALFSLDLDGTVFTPCSNDVGVKN